MDSRLPPHGEPVRPLTPRQEQVVDLLALGWSFQRIGIELGIDERTVGDHVDAVARILPNEGGLPPEKLVRAWGGWRVWRKHFAKHPALKDAGPPITSGNRAD